MLGKKTGTRAPVVDCKAAWREKERGRRQTPALLSASTHELRHLFLPQSSDLHFGERLYCYFDQLFSEAVKAVHFGDQFVVISHQQDQLFIVDGTGTSTIFTRVKQGDKVLKISRKT